MGRSKVQRVARRMQSELDIPYSQALGTVRETLELDDIEERLATKEREGLRHDDALLAVVNDVWGFDG